MAESWGERTCLGPYLLFMLGLCFKLLKSCAIDPDLFLVFETMEWPLPFASFLSKNFGRNVPEVIVFCPNGEHTVFPVQLYYFYFV
jgi:hypothetical protein